MAEGASSALAAELLDAIFNADAYSVANVWVQLHTAAPGAAGTTAVAGNDTRKQLSMAAASGGTITSDTALTWTSGEVDTSEQYTKVTLWTASTAGTFLASGTLTANPVTAGDVFTIPIADFDVAMPTAS